MKEIGWYHRFVMIMGDNNAKVKPCYRDSVCGDSPEQARGTDSFGFRDLELSMAYHIALTYELGRDNPNKFQMGTPAEVWRCMMRCWTVEPTSERVIQDFMDYPRIQDMIIGSEGCVVHGEAMRSGHRVRRADGKGMMKERLRTSSRVTKPPIRPVHTDAQASFDTLVGIPGRVEEIANEMDLAEENVLNELLLVENIPDHNIEDNDRLEEDQLYDFVLDMTTEATG
jgi:hypothetical protein